jgi:hypothetical protein
MFVHHTQFLITHCAQVFDNTVGREFLFSGLYFFFSNGVLSFMVDENELQLEKTKNKSQIDSY